MVAMNLKPGSHTTPVAKYVRKFESQELEGKNAEIGSPQQAELLRRESQKAPSQCHSGKRQTGATFLASAPGGTNQAQVLG